MKSRDDIYLIQVKMNIRMKNQIQRLADEHNLTCADIVRGSLDLGIRATEKLLEAQELLAIEYLRLLRLSKHRKNNGKRKAASKTARAQMQTMIHRNLPLSE